MAFKPPKTGVEYLEGKPGSGKSYEAVCRCARAITTDRRPCYTNLPIKSRVLRKYLRGRGGHGLEQYIITLSPEHFKKFLARFAKLALVRESFRAEGRSDSEAEAEFMRAYGDHVSRPGFKAHVRIDDTVSTIFVYADDRAAAERQLAAHHVLKLDPLVPNWIEYGSYIIIDELHRWLNQRDQKDESPDVLTFASMHRHGLYYVLLLTQDAMQTSISFRRQCVEYTRAVDKRRVPILGSLTIPIPIFFYARFNSEMLGRSNTVEAIANAKPIETYTRIPWLTSGLVWRLYDSFTHCGSKRKLALTMEKTRESIEGVHYQKRKKVPKRKGVGVVGWAWRGVAVTSIAWMAYRQGRGDGVAAQPVAVSNAAAPVVRHVSYAGATSRPTSQPVDVVEGFTGVRCTVVADEFCVVDGAVVTKGERLGDYVFVGADVERGAAVFASDRERVVWPVGGHPIGLPPASLRKARREVAPSEPGQPSSSPTRPAAGPASRAGTGG